MESQKAIKIKGGTMRLGAYNCKIKKGTQVYSAYKKMQISERHRHRYEVNNRYRKKLEKFGLTFSGINQDLGVVEAIAISNPPWYVATQFHPEWSEEQVANHCKTLSKHRRKTFPLPHKQHKYWSQYR